MNAALKKFWADELGSASIEYALIAIICSVSIIAALYDLRDGVNHHLDSASGAMAQGAN